MLYYILFYYILFYSILFYCIIFCYLFYSILPGAPERGARRRDQRQNLRGVRDLRGGETRQGGAQRSLLQRSEDPRVCLRSGALRSAGSFGLNERASKRSVSSGTMCDTTEFAAFLRSL